MHPLCSTLRVFDITDTSVTNGGLLLILRRMIFVHSLGEFGISDNFLRSLRVVSSLRMDKFSITNLHSRFPIDCFLYIFVNEIKHEVVRLGFCSSNWELKVWWFSKGASYLISSFLTIFYLNWLELSKKTVFSLKVKSW